MQPVPKRGMGCAETNLRYPRTSSTPAATPNVFDPEVCYEQCMADAACLLAVHDGVNHECTMHTRDAMGCNFDSVPSISVILKLATSNLKFNYAPQDSRCPSLRPRRIS